MAKFELTFERELQVRQRAVVVVDAETKDEARKLGEAMVDDNEGHDRLDELMETERTQSECGMSLEYIKELG